MGTSLTGTKPKDTYDALIKVGDNGPISGTAKVLSDGLGNDLPIAVSTSNVGIGTSSPSAKLHVAGENIILDRTGGDPFISFYTGGTTNNVALYGGASTGLRAFVGGSERIRVTSDGLTFNGDTAAANALDDYEEGTWTPVFRGATTAGTYTYSAGVSGAGYRKIGSQVTVWCSLIDIVESSAGTGDWEIAGLPFAVANNLTFSRGNGNLYVRQSAAARSSLLVLFANNGTVVFPVYNNGSSSASAYTIAADYAANMDIGFVITYFV